MSNAEIDEAIELALAALNPISGFLRRRPAVAERYLESVRIKLRAAQEEIRVRGKP
jgi:hypothetical protein